MSGHRKIAGDNIIVEEAGAGRRIDSFLAEKTGITRSQIQKLFEKGSITVNDSPVSQHYRVKISDRVCFEIPPEETLSPTIAVYSLLQAVRSGRVWCTGWTRTPQG